MVFFKNGILRNGCAVGRYFQFMGFFCYQSQIYGSGKRCSSWRRVWGPWLPRQRCAFRLRKPFLKQTNAFDPEVDIKCEILMLLEIQHHCDSLLGTFRSSGRVVQTWSLPAGVL